MRVVMQELALFLLPIVLFALYVWIRNMVARQRGEAARPLESGPVYWAILAGLVCALGGIVFFGVSDTSGTGDNLRYEPPRVIDGELKPGRVYKKE